MPAFQPTADQFRAFREDPHDGPIAQVNLLKFRVTSAYGVDEPEHGIDEPGAIAHRRYVDAFEVAAGQVGASCLLYGETERNFFGQGDWDAVLVMHFPSRAAFIQPLDHPDYDEMHRHRNAGLLCQELLTTRAAVAWIEA